MARLAERQHGVVSRAQLLAIGIAPSTIDRWLIEGRLHPVHPGACAVGHRGLSRDGLRAAAVLACGEGAALAYFSAASKLRILERELGPLHVVAERGHCDGVSGVHLHRTRSLPPGHLIERDGIPVTTPERTLLDLAAVMASNDLRFAVEAADRLRLLHVPSLVASCDASSGRRGAATLRRLAREQRGPISRTKSPPERRFLRGCLDRGLPGPLVNAIVDGYEVDFSWPAAKLIVEIDSSTYHRSWPQRKRDLARDAHLQTRGHRVLRYTEDDLSGAGHAFAQVEALLAPAERRP